MATVLLLHGFPQTSHAWCEVAGPLRDAGHEVVAPDLWGAGIEAGALALIDEPVHRVGHDVGAGSAWRLAAEHPDRVRSLTAVIGPHAAAFTADHVSGPYRFEALEGAGHWIPDLHADRLVPPLLDHVGGA